MHLDRCGIEREGLDLDAHDLLQLQFLEHPVEYAALRPAVHPGIDGVPVAEPLRQPTPLAAMLRHIQQSVEQLQVGKAHIAALYRQAVFNLCVLLFGDFHLSRNYTSYVAIVLTRPNSPKKSETPDLVRLQRNPSPAGGFAFL